MKHKRCEDICFYLQPFYKLKMSEEKGDTPLFMENNNPKL